MEDSPPADRSHRLVCPLCEVGELRLSASVTWRCDLCYRDIASPFVEALRQIAALPEPLGKHACECAHPEMRRLPDGIFHCPACGSEVTPVGEPPSRPETHDARRGMRSKR